MRIRRWIRLLALALLLALLPGCMFAEADELYTLPRHTDQYNNLQAELDSLLAAGAKYAGPATGDNQQAIQMADLTGDGVDEVIAFLNTGGDKPLKVYIYKLRDSAYEPLATLEYGGSAFDRVDYAQIDENEGLEIVLATQVSDQIVQGVSVYCVDHDAAAELLSTNGLKYTVADVNGDTRADVLVLRAGADGQNGQAELYCHTDGTLHSVGTAPMSLPLGTNTVRRITTGYTQQNVQAIFVASAYEQTGLVTDVYALRNSALANIAALDPAQQTLTLRSGEIYATDLDGDGLIELPSMMQMQPLEEGDATAYYLTNWYNLTLDGRKVVKQTTYYDQAGGWYLTIPAQWTEMSVSYGPDETGDVCYSFYSRRNLPQRAKKLAAVYVFSGTNAQEKAVENGRFVLERKGDLVYAAALTDDANLQPDEFSALFHLIRTQWDF